MAEQLKRPLRISTDLFPALHLMSARISKKMSTAKRLGKDVMKVVVLHTAVGAIGSEHDKLGGEFGSCFTSETQHTFKKLCHESSPRDTARRHRSVNDY